jgi:heme-degrading monooxygenase HmoA
MERESLRKADLMIVRIWHGWTTPEDADAYERLLKEEIFPGIAGKEVPGYRGIQLLRRPIESGEVEFVTIMRFDSWEDVGRFAGEDYERAYVPQKAREVLSRFDERSQHYEVRVSLEYRP